MSSAANGVMYKVVFTDQSVTNAANQDIIQIIAAAGVPVVIHAIKLSFVPSIVSGVAQDVRANLRWVVESTDGSGGSAVTPRATNQRNTLAAAGTYTQLRTTPGTAGNVLGSEQVSIIVPYERVFTASQRLIVPGGTRLALNLIDALGASYDASLEMDVEEI